MTCASTVVRHFGRGRELANRRFRGRQAVRGDRPDIDLQVASFRHDIGPRAATDHPDIHGHTWPATVERVEILHEPGGFQDGTAPLLGFHARMGGPTVDREAGIEDALAGTHDVAVGAGTFEDQARIHVRGGLADMHAGARGADLLVGVRDEDEPLERQAAELGVMALRAYNPARSPDFMSLTPGP